MPNASAASDRPGSQAAVSHHSLCFGCGAANLFGLQAEITRAGSRGVGGRFFVKQDHQGASGHLHEGLLAAALQEAMSLAAQCEGRSMAQSRLELSIEQSAPVGCFVGLRAWVSGSTGAELRVDATAQLDGETDSDTRIIARGSGLFCELASSG